MEAEVSQLILPQLRFLVGVCASVRPAQRYAQICILALTFFSHQSFFFFTSVIIIRLHSSKVGLTSVSVVWFRLGYFYTRFHGARVAGLTLPARLWQLYLLTIVLFGDPSESRAGYKSCMMTLSLTHALRFFPVQCIFHNVRTLSH